MGNSQILLLPYGETVSNPTVSLSFAVSRSTKSSDRTALDDRSFSMSRSLSPLFLQGPLIHQGGGSGIPLTSLPVNLARGAYVHKVDGFK